MQQVSENSIMELIRQRGILRFSTLMVSFHLSSVEAISIVEEYQRRGILDAKGRYVPEMKSIVEAEVSKTQENAELSALKKSEKTEEAKKPEKIETKIKTIKQTEKTKQQSAEKQSGTVKKAERKQEENRKKKKTKKLIRRDIQKTGASEIEGQMSLFDYLPFN